MVDKVAPYFNNLMLIVTEQCNLRCSYCYEQGMAYNHKHMSFDTAKKAVDMMFAQIPEDVQKTSISFFGGEPALAFGLIKQVIEYSLPHRTISGYTGNDCNYALNTNGTVLTDEMAALYASLGKRLNLRVSVGGYGDVHNMTRKTIQGGGSWDMVAANLSKFKTLRNDYGVRINLVSTLNKKNCSTMYDDYTRLYELTGMGTAILFVHEDSWDEKDFQVIKEQVWRMKEYSITNKTTLPLCKMAIEKNYANESICNAGVRSITVNSDGILYPCHRCYFCKADQDYVIGNVVDGIDVEKRSKIAEINQLCKLPQECQVCPPVVRTKCHICFPTNKKVCGDFYGVNLHYCALLKELHEMLETE